MSDIKDPSILINAERTILSWNRISISLMGFGFVVERFGMYLEMARHDNGGSWQRNMSFSIGLLFVFLASIIAVYSIRQHWRILHTLSPASIPPGYNLRFSTIANSLIGILGGALIIYLLLDFV